MYGEQNMNDKGAPARSLLHFPFHLRAKIGKMGLSLLEKGLFQI